MNKPKPRPRSDAYSPRSVCWTLYKPEKLAEKLNVPVEAVDIALEETGFNKAVRIREETIRWKTRLIDEQRNLHGQHKQLHEEIQKVNTRIREVDEMLVNIRNILRIPREKERETEQKARDNECLRYIQNPAPNSKMP